MGIGKRIGEAVAGHFEYPNPNDYEPLLETQDSRHNRMWTLVERFAEGDITEEEFVEQCSIHNLNDILEPEQE